MFARILGAIGRSFITVGTLILLFVAYQLWGTAIHEARAQRELTAEFDELLASTPAQLPGEDLPGDEDPDATTTTVDPDDPAEDPDGPEDDPDDTTTTTEVVPADDLPSWLPEWGDPVAKISIPDIGITRTVVEGDDDPQLKRGMGHVDWTPLPGQAGNVSIAGHRTTYGQPLHNIDKLPIGALIHFETIQGEFTYEVFEHEIVQPEQVEIMDDMGDNRLTLIACHPKWSLAQRYIVYAELVGNPADDLPGQEEIRRANLERSGGDDGRTSIDGASDDASRAPVLIWGLVCALIWLATWLVQRFLRRRLADRTGDDERTPTRRERLLTWSPYLVGLPIFLVALYFFFENFSVLLPGSY